MKVGDLYEHRGGGIALVREFFDGGKRVGWQSVLNGTKSVGLSEEMQLESVGGWRFIGHVVDVADVTPDRRFMRSCAPCGIGFVMLDGQIDLCPVCHRRAICPCCQSDYSSDPESIRRPSEWLALRLAERKPVRVGSV